MGSDDSLHRTWSWGTGIAFVLAAELNGRVGAVRTSIVTYLIPIVAVFLGVVFRNDSITLWAILAQSLF